MMLTDIEWLQGIWAALRRIEDNLALPPAPLELPAPQVTVLPPTIDLTDVIEAVNSLKPGATAIDIASALADLLAPPAAPTIEGLGEMVAAIKDLAWRMKGMGAQAYGGGAVTLAPNTTFPVSSTFQSNQTGTWGYKAGVSGTVVIAAATRVIGIAAHATVAGSMTVNGGDSLPIPANVQFAFTPLGNLVAPTIVFTGTDSYAVETLA